MADRTTRDLDAKLAAWLAARAPDSVPPEFTARILAIPRTTADDRRVLRTIDGTRRRMLLLVAATVTSVALIGGGLLIAGRQARDDAPRVEQRTPAPSGAQPTASDAPWRADSVLPAAIPPGFDHGIVQTPLGRARWVHWQGDALTLADPLPQPLPDGRFLWFEPAKAALECETMPSTDPRCVDPVPRLWVADDLLATRRLVPLPTSDRNAWFVRGPDRFWLLAEDPVGIWWTTDGSTWETTDAGAIRSPGPAIPWRVTFRAPVTIAGAPALWARFSAADPGALLGGPGRSLSLTGGDGGTYGVRENRRLSEGGSRDLGSVTVEVRDGSVSFVAANGDGPLGRVDGVGLDFVEAWARRGEIVEQQLYVLDGDRWTPVDVPLGPHAAPGLLDERPEGVIAIGADARGQARLARSTDGRTWTGGEPLVDADGTPISSRLDDFWVDDRDGVRTLIINRDGEERWASTDGVTWTLGPFGESPLGMPVAGGFVQTPDQNEAGEWRVSRDRVDWESAPELSAVTTKISPNGAGGSSESPVGGAIWFRVEEDAGPYDVWVVEFEGTAAS